MKNLVRVSNGWGKLIGYFEEGEPLRTWLAGMMERANGPDRVNGEYGSYSPLTVESFTFERVKVTKPTKAREREILNGQIGGWASPKTLEFIRQRDETARRRSSGEGNMLDSRDAPRV